MTAPTNNSPNTNTNNTLFFKEKFIDNRTEGETTLKQAQRVMLRMLKIIDHICKQHNIQYWLEGGTLLGAIRHQGFIPWDDDVDISMLRDDYNKFIEVAAHALPQDLFLQTPATDKGFYNLATQLRVRDCNSQYIEKHETGNESYHTGIFIDIFPIDVMSDNTTIRAWRNWVTKKMQRLLCAKHSEIPLGHGYHFYRRISCLFSKKWLQARVKNIIKKGNAQQAKELGFGYDTVVHGYFARDTIFPLGQAKFEDAEFPVPHRYHDLLTQFYGDYMTPVKVEANIHAKNIVPCITSNTDTGRT